MGERQGNGWELSREAMNVKDGLVYRAIGTWIQRDAFQDGADPS